MADKYGPSIVGINTFDKNGESVGSGSGFFIDHNGALVTNHHVLERCDRALLVTGGAKTGEITAIIKDDPERDLLVAGTTFEKTLPIPFPPPAGIRINDNVICLAKSEKPHTIISMGRVTDIIPVNDFKVIKISAPILPGLSGAAILDRKGRLIAIATAYLDIEKGVFFAVPSDYLRHLEVVRFDLKSLPLRRVELGATVRGNKLLGLGLYKFGSSPLTVYFKDGQCKHCDRAWLEGDTVYLVMSGKAFAVGYSKDEIDMQKSFGR